MNEQNRLPGSWRMPWRWRPWTLSEVAALLVASGLLYILSFLIVILCSLPITDPQVYGRIRAAYFPLFYVLEQIVRP